MNKIYNIIANYMYIQLYINNYMFNTKVLKTPKNITNGMMGKTFDDKFDALLFDTNIINTQEQSFWMKNCIVPLDIIFIKNGKINKIYNNCPPCTTNNCKKYSGKGDYIIEMPGGTCKNLKFKKNDIITINNK